MNYSMKPRWIPKSFAFAESAYSPKCFAAKYYPFLIKNVYWGKKIVCEEKI